MAILTPSEKIERAFHIVHGSLFLCTGYKIHLLCSTYAPKYNHPLSRGDIFTKLAYRPWIAKYGPFSSIILINKLIRTSSYITGIDTSITLSKYLNQTWIQMTVAELALLSMPFPAHLLYYLITGDKFNYCQYSWYWQAVKLLDRVAKVSILSLSKIVLKQSQLSKG